MPAYGKVKVDTITYDLSGTATDVSVSNIATKASPTFTGTVTIPTPTAGDNSTKAASTAFVVASFATKASPTFTGTINAADLVLSGDLTVNGSTTTIDTTTLQVEDKNIQIGKVSTPSDVTADGGGLTLLGATNKTWNWVNSTDAWTSSEHIHLGDDKKLLVGTGSDLSIYHDGTNSRIDNGTGAFILRTTGSFLVQNSGGSEVLIDADIDGAVTLYHDNSAKLATTATGCTVTGTLAATAVTGDGSGLTNLPPGGNTFTAVANGAIANNKAVKIDTDGKVSEINESTTLITSSLVNSATGILYLASQNAYQKNHRLAYSPDDDLTVQVYTDGGSPYYSKSGLWKTHSSSPGEVQQIGSHTTIHSVGSNADGNNDICYLSSSRFVYVYNRNDSMRCRVAVGTISGSGDSRTISWSNDQQLDGLSTSFYSSYKIRKIGTNRVAVFAVAGNNNCRWTDGKPGILIADVSSSTVTYRSSSILVSQNADLEFDRCSLAYNSTDDLLLAGWRRNSSNHYYRAIKVASGTSATITLTSSQYELAETQLKRNIVWHPTQNKFVLVYNKEASDNSNPGEILTRVLTVNSSSLAISTTSASVISGSGNKADQGLFALVTALNSIQIKTIGSNRQPYTYADDSFNGTAFNIDREGKTTTGFDQNLEICVQSVCLSEDPNQTILSVYGSTTSTTSNKPSAITVKSANVTSSLTDASQYVGYTDQAYTNGQTATIKTYGNNVDTLSGLTAGSIYYVQGDGTIGTSWDSGGLASFATNTPLAGTALSATKLLIRDPLAKT
jgi:hypothetical protein